MFSVSIHMYVCMEVSKSKIWIVKHLLIGFLKYCSLTELIYRHPKASNQGKITLLNNQQNLRLLLVGIYIIHTTTATTTNESRGQACKFTAQMNAQCENQIKSLLSSPPSQNLFQKVLNFKITSHIILDDV